MPVAQAAAPRAANVVHVDVVSDGAGERVGELRLQAALVRGLRGGRGGGDRARVVSAMGCVDATVCAACQRLVDHCDAAVDAAHLPGVLHLALQLRVDSLAHEVLSQVLLRVRDILADWTTYESLVQVAVACGDDGGIDLSNRVATGVLACMLEDACAHNIPPAVDRLIAIRTLIQDLPATAFTNMYTKIAAMRDDDLFAETHKNMGYLFAGLVGCVWASTADWISRVPSLQYLYRLVVSSKVYPDFKRHLLRYAARYNEALVACTALGNELLCAQSVLHRLERCLERGDDAATLVSQSQASLSMASSYPMSMSHSPTITQMSEFSMNYQE